jgi:rhodanese-related sulfurtransferase
MDRPSGLPSNSTIRKPAASVSVASLMAQIGKGAAPPLLDVRDAAVFHPRHLPGSQNAPDSQTTALIRKLQTVGSAILICNDGKLSSMVARTLGFVKINSVSYLEGGIEAWAAAGGKLMETTRSGFEHELRPMPKDEAAEEAKTPITARLIRGIKSIFNPGEEDSAK